MRFEEALTECVKGQKIQNTYMVENIYLYFEDCYLKHKTLLGVKDAVIRSSWFEVEWEVISNSDQNIDSQDNSIDKTEIEDQILTELQKINIQVSKLFDKYKDVMLL